MGLLAVAILVAVEQHDGEAARQFFFSLHSVQFAPERTAGTSIDRRGTALSKGRFGCGGRTRTSDHLINNQALYQLSYTTALLRKDRHGHRSAILMSTAAVVAF